MLVINQQTGTTGILFSTHEINYKCLHNFEFDFVFCESRQVNNLDTEQVKKILHPSVVVGTIKLA